MGRVYLASDHGGFALKESLKPFIERLGYTVHDCGAYTLDPSDDYPDVILPCAKKVVEDAGSFGIVLGASGQGEAMAANSVPGARAAVYYGAPNTSQTDADGTELSMLASVRNHNNANILSLGGRFITLEEAEEAVRTFLETPFSGNERHQRRIAKF